MPVFVFGNYLHSGVVEPAMGGRPLSQYLFLFRFVDLLVCGCKGNPDAFFSPAIQPFPFALCSA